MLHRQCSIVLIVVLLLEAMVIAAPQKPQEALYLGGTVTAVPEATEGTLQTTDEKKLTFNSTKGSFSIDYDKITSLEYGQKAGRRVGVAIVITVWALFSKKRKHYLTIGYTDADSKPQGIVIEIPKGTAKKMITILEVRSGKKVEYESEEAKKHVHG